MRCVLTVVTCLVFSSAIASDTGSRKLKGNILCLMMFPSPSHHGWNRVLMKALADDGYNVTALSVDIDKEPTPNLHYIHLEGVYDGIYKGEEPLDLLAVSTLSIYENIKLTYLWTSLFCKIVLNTNGFQTLLKYPSDMKFDLIIYDSTCGPCLLPFLDRFPKAPLLSITPFFTTPFELTGTPLFPSYNPHYTHVSLPRMNFFQRVYSLAIYVIDSYHRKLMVESQDVLLREYFGPNMKYLGSYEDRNELLLVNSHPALQHPQPLMPNVIQVGGLQIKESSPIAEDIEKFLSSGTAGSVLFSLGTNMKSEMLGDEKLQMFINVIRRLPEYNFLWKFESDSLPPLPKNLMIKKWISQNDILTHPNLKLFLSHAGSLSTQEAAWHGVPVLAMPFFADQPENAFLMIQDGVAEQLNFFTLTENEMYNALKKMLEDSSYTKNMKRRSIQFRDRPQHPLQLALFWCKYLMRNGHAQHLRSVAWEMPHYVQHMWDVLLVLIGLVLTVGCLISKLICSFRHQRNVKVKKN